MKEIYDAYKDLSRKLPNGYPCHLNTKPPSKGSKDIQYIELGNKMDGNNLGKPWAQIRLAYPHQWLVIEAINPHSVLNKRILEAVRVVSTFNDSADALREYLRLHRENHNKELYVVHTDKEVLDITEQKWLGIRPV